MANEREELAALRRLAELESKASGQAGNGLLTTRAEADMFRARQENPELARMADRGRSLPSAESIAGSKVYRFAQGAADLPIGLAQTGANLIAGATGLEGGADVINEFVNRRENLIRAGRAETGSEGLDWTRLAGNVALAMALGGKLPTASTLQGRVLQGAAEGAAFGAATPTEGEGVGDVLKTKGISALLGGALGGAIPAGIELGKIVGGKISRMTDLTPEAAERRLARALRDVSGDKVDDVIAQLRANPNEINAGMAAVNAGSSGFSAFDDAVAQMKDVRFKEQGALNKYRLELLNWAGTTDEVEALKKARESISKDFLKTKTELSPELMKIIESNVVQEVVPEAVKLTEDQLARGLRNRALDIPGRTTEVQSLNPSTLMPERQITEEISRPIMEAAETAAREGKEKFQVINPATLQPETFWTNEIISKRAPLLAKAVRASGKGQDVQRISPSTLMPKTETIQAIDDPLMVSATSRGATLGQSGATPGISRISGMFEQPKYEIDSRLLQNIKLGLDAKIGGRPDTAIDELMRGQRVGAKKSIVDFMRQNTPGYDEFRSEYMRQSVPIDQMQLAQALRSKLKNPLSEFSDDETLRQNAAAFARAVVDEPKTIRSASGRQIYEKLADVFTPDQMASINEVSKSLNKEVRLRNLIKEGAKITESELHDMKLGQLPGMLERSILLANRALKELGDKQVKDVLDLYASVRTNPVKVAEIMEKANKQSPAVANALKLVDWANKKGISAKAIPPMMAGQLSNELTE